MTYPLGDIDIDVFLRDYWHKKPLLIRNALPDVKAPVDADELAGLALDEEVESRLIQFNPKADDWHLDHGPLAEERFSELPEKNWTLLVQGVDHWVPEAADLLEQFNFIPNWRVDDLMISYAVDGGGVGPHYDNYDVFLIQTSGTRRWELGPLCDENSPRRDNTPVMILPEWNPEVVYELNPGDILYLPPRVAHNGIAVGDDCMTCSVAFALRPTMRFCAASVISLANRWDENSAMQTLTFPILIMPARSHHRHCHRYSRFCNAI